MTQMLAIQDRQAAAPLRLPRVAGRPRPQALRAPGMADLGDAPAAATADRPAAMEWAELPLPDDDGRGSARMLAWAMLGGLGFWVVVGVLVF